ncbi:MAG TPA: hypothetical protein VJY47_02850 [Candidatus Dojkabacteria bacterium]|nr:hypothetical protein [Candidatus Dojkabacteria bacterium]
MSKGKGNIIVKITDLIKNPDFYQGRDVAVLGDRFQLVRKVVILEKGKDIPVYYYNLYQGDRKIVLYTKQENLEEKENYLIEGEWRMSFDRSLYYLH